MRSQGRIGIIADDLTGATDAGVVFAKRGWRTRVLFGSLRARRGCRRVDVVVVDTETRRESPHRAYEKAHAAARFLKRLGCGRVYKKIDSGFRGNVGAEVEAAMVGLGVGFTIVAPAFPKNGRITRNGYHYVRGRLLEESDLARDPVHPMRESFLPRMLQAQTRKKVGLVTCRSLANVTGARAALTEARKRWGMAIMDATEPRHLAAMAAAADELPLVCGSGGLAEEVARRLPKRAWPRPGQGRKWPRVPVLLVSGSVTDATAVQVAEAGRAGMGLIPVDLAAALGGRRNRAQEIARLAAEGGQTLRQGRHAIVYLPFEHSRRSVGSRTAARLTAVLADAAARILGRRKGAGTKLVLVGGDTAASVCRRLGVGALDVLGEVQPGVARVRTIGRRTLDVVLKPGSFGDKKCLVDAVGRLQGRDA